MNRSRRRNLRVFRRSLQATPLGWLQTSLVVVFVGALTLLIASPLAAADPAKQQLEFGIDMAKRGLWSEALFRFQQAARLEPNNPRILNNIAVAYEALGLFDEALESYQAALRAGPSDRELKSNYSSFVEFYQNFRPREPEEEPSGESVETTAGGER